MEAERTILQRLADMEDLLTRLCEHIDEYLELKFEDFKDDIKTEFFGEEDQ